MAALATPTQLGTYLGADIDDEDARALLVLSTVSGVVVRLAGTVGDGWTDEDVPDDVLGVVLAAAARRWVNPYGATDTRTGPFSTSYASEWLTSEEREVVAAYNSSAVAGLSSVRVRASLNPARIAYGDPHYDESWWSS